MSLRSRVGFDFFFDEENKSQSSEFTIAIYRRSETEWEQILGGKNDSGAVLRAEAGAQYRLRVGTNGNALGGSFKLFWEEGAPGVWLKYIGVLKNGYRDKNGHVIELERVAFRAPLALSGDGTALYMGTEKGIHVYKREPDIGELSFAQLLEFEQGISPLVLWDSSRNRLYAKYCTRWSMYDATDGVSWQLGERASVKISGQKNSSSCTSRQNDALFMDSSGSIIYSMDYQGVQVFAVRSDGFELIQELELDKIEYAVVSTNHIFILKSSVGTSSPLLVYSRDVETGKLALSQEFSVPASKLITISDDANFLFTVGINERHDVNIYRLESGEVQMLIGELENLPAQFHWNLIKCSFATPRKGLVAVDVFCDGFAFSLEWRSDTEELVFTDFLGLDNPDRYDNLVPDYGRIYGSVTNPGGKHTYLTTEEGSIVIIERVGNTAGNRSTTPVLTLASGVLRLPMTQYRDTNEMLCFAAEFQGTSESDSWQESRNWALSVAEDIQCNSVTDDVPFIDAGSSVLHIPYGKIQSKGETTCFSAELQAYDDYRNWTLLAGNNRVCP